MSVLSLFSGILSSVQPAFPRLCWQSQSHLSATLLWTDQRNICWALSIHIQTCPSTSPPGGCKITSDQDSGRRNLRFSENSTEGVDRQMTNLLPEVSGLNEWTLGSATSSTSSTVTNQPRTEDWWLFKPIDYFSLRNFVPSAFDQRKRDLRITCSLSYVSTLRKPPTALKLWFLTYSLKFSAHHAFLVIFLTFVFSALGHLPH